MSYYTIWWLWCGVAFVVGMVLGRRLRQMRQREEVTDG